MSNFGFIHKLKFLPRLLAAQAPHASDLSRTIETAVLDGAQLPRARHAAEAPKEGTGGSHAPADARRESPCADMRVRHTLKAVSLTWHVETTVAQFGAHSSAGNCARVRARSGW